MAAIIPPEVLSTKAVATTTTLAASKGVGTSSHALEPAGYLLVRLLHQNRQRCEQVCSAKLVHKIQALPFSTHAPSDNGVTAGMRSGTTVADGMIEQFDMGAAGVKHNTEQDSHKYIKANMHCYKQSSTTRDTQVHRGNSALLQAQQYQETPTNTNTQWHRLHCYKHNSISRLHMPMSAN